MSETDNTSQYHSIQDPFIYDTETLNRFADAVFPDLDDDEFVLGWPVKTVPGYPIDADELISKTLARSSQPLALYYGTSTAAPDPELRKLFNRQALCKRYFVVVLDDIGTKVPLDDLPVALREKPTYVIESSEGNFQYGYVLTEPLTDMAVASVLIRLLYEAGLSDSGGAMPNKLVRLPGGVNGKPGERGAFKVRLVALNEGVRWTPQELLSAAELDVSWEEVKSKGAGTLRRPQARTVTPWSAVEGHSPNVDGTLDPVLEWLYEQRMVLQETGNWVTIRCPWADQHTTGEDTAGYAPTGRGEGEQQAMRGFHCFHEHCATRRSSEFLAWVEAMGGPGMPAYDPTTRLHHNWTYDPNEDLAYPAFDTDLLGDNTAGIKLGVMRRLFPKKVLVPAGDRGFIKRSIVDVWVESPHRVLTQGIMPDPTTTARLTTTAGRQVINTFRAPQHKAPDLTHYDKDIERWTDFLDYLIPDPDERTFFIDWLAAKTQSQAFRGPAILMTTPIQGTGRSTLGIMIGQLLGRSNTVTLTYDQLVNGGQFNDWLLHTMVICNEVFEGRTGNNAARFYRGYERLKALIETQPMQMDVNRKNQHQRSYTIYASYLMFSNHADALPLEEVDRRIYVIRNAITPRNGDYFAALNQWLRSEHWADSVYTWLRAREVDTEALLVPQGMTKSKEDMVRESMSPVMQAVSAVIEHWQGDYISVAALQAVLEDGRVNYMLRLTGSSTPAQNRTLLKHALERLALRPIADIAKRLRVRAFDKQHQPYVLKSAPLKAREALMDGTIDRDELATQIRQNDPDALLTLVLEEH